MGRRLGRGACDSTDLVSRADCLFFFEKISLRDKRVKRGGAGGRQQKKEMSSGENDKNVRVTLKNEAYKKVCGVLFWNKHSSHDESCPASPPPTHEDKAHLSLATQSARIPPLQSLFKNTRTSFFSFLKLELNSSTILSTSS